MMVHFFTHRLARVDLAFILHLNLHMSVFDSTGVRTVQSHFPIA